MCHSGYPLMSKALNATGRPIAYSCSWPVYVGGLPPNVSVIITSSAGYRLKNDDTSLKMIQTLNQTH